MNRKGSSNETQFSICFLDNMNIVVRPWQGIWEKVTLKSLHVFLTLIVLNVIIIVLFNVYVINCIKIQLISSIK